MDFQTSLQVLNVLAEALTVPHSLSEALEHLTKMTGELMETEQTVILLRDEERHELIVRTHDGIGGTHVRTGFPLEVPPRLKSILWNVRSLHQINWVESGIEAIGFPILVMPLRIRGERIGILITGKARQGTAGFDPIRRRLYALVGPLPPW